MRSLFRLISLINDLKAIGKGPSGVVLRAERKAYYRNAARIERRLTK